MPVTGKWRKADKKETIFEEADAWLNDENGELEAVVYPYCTRTDGKLTEEGWGWHVTTTGRRHVVCHKTKEEAKTQALIEVDLKR